MDFPTNEDTENLRPKSEPVPEHVHNAFMREVIEADEPTIVYHLIPGRDLSSTLGDIMRSLTAIAVLRRRKGKHIKFTIKVTDEQKPKDAPGDLYVQSQNDGPLTQAARQAVHEILEADKKVVERVDKFGKGLHSGDRDFLESCHRFIRHGRVLTGPMRSYLKSLDENKVP